MGDGVMIWDIGIDMYTLMCIKWMTNKNKKKKKTAGTVIEFSPTMLLITLNVKNLNTSIKRQRLSD